MAKKYSVVWTDEARRQVDGILHYLHDNWGEREAADFLDLLFHFEKTITFFPKAFQKSARFKRCRLGLVHRHVTALYQVDRNQISVLTVFDNRSNNER